MRTIFQPKNKHKMNYIVTVFAGIFARFKQKNPAVAGIIALVLLCVVYAADQGTLLGVFTLPTWAAEAVKWLGIIATTVNGASTHQFQTEEGFFSRK